MALAIASISCSEDGPSLCGGIQMMLEPVSPLPLLQQSWVIYSAFIPYPSKVKEAEGDTCPLSSQAGWWHKVPPNPLQALCTHLESQIKQTSLALAKRKQEENLFVPVLHARVDFPPPCTLSLSLPSSCSFGLSIPLKFTRGF